MPDRILFSILAVCLLISLNASSQIQRSMRVENVYNKKTGEKLNQREIQELIEANPGMVFEKEFDKYGEVNRLYFHPDSIITGRHSTRNPENMTKVGEVFPPFVFRTVDGRKIDSEKLLGEWIMVRFEVFARMTKKEPIADLSLQLDQMKDTPVHAILVYADNFKNVRDEFQDGSNGKFSLVSDASNFQERYSITISPTTVIIDPEGRVFKYIGPNEKVDLTELMK